MSTSLCESPTTEDRYWILAAPMLDTIADDLAVCRSADWWQDNPAEMTGRCWESDQLLRELHGSGVQMLADVVNGETSGRIQIDTGWIVRRAKWKSTHGQQPRRHSALQVAAAIRLPLLTLYRPDVVKPWNEDYHDLRARHLCTACGTALDPDTDRAAAGHFFARCKICRDHHSDRQKAVDRRKRPPGPTGGIPWLEWSKQKRTELKISQQQLLRWMAKGKVPRPQIVKHTARSWWVIPEERTAA